MIFKCLYDKVDYLKWGDTTRIITKYMCIAIVYIVMGKRLACSPAKHTLDLTPRIRRFLFIVDIPCSRVSITGVIWQILFYVTACSFLVAYLLFEVESEWILGLFDFIMTVEWIGIGLPLTIYSTVCEAIRK